MYICILSSQGYLEQHPHALLDVDTEVQYMPLPEG